MIEATEELFVRMNPIVKRHWVSALKSGRFPQGRGMLRTTKGYCCLGVLCELYRIAHPNRAVWTKAAGSEYAFYFLGEVGVLPKAVQEWAGLVSDKGSDVIPFNNRQLSLVEINDMSVPFERIAPLVEAYL